jgi:hypothetical protein
MPSILAKPEKQSRTAPSVMTETRMTTNPRQCQNFNTLVSTHHQTFPSSVRLAILVIPAQAGNQPAPNS